MENWTRGESELETERKLRLQRREDDRVGVGVESGFGFEVTRAALASECELGIANRRFAVPCAPMCADHPEG